MGEYAVSETNRWKLELEQYIRQSEPDKAEKSKAWETAIGLQDVDGLKTSAYLLGSVPRQNTLRSFLKICF